MACDMVDTRFNGYRGGEKEGERGIRSRGKRKDERKQRVYTG